MAPNEETSSLGVDQVNSQQIVDLLKCAKQVNFTTRRTARTPSGYPLRGLVSPFSIILSAS